MGFTDDLREIAEQVVADTKQASKTGDTEWLYRMMTANAEDIETLFKRNEVKVRPVQG
jgi:hypothetical protein